MANLFISYSRKDKESARRLTEAFQGQELDFWIDWEGIPPTVDWWKEIEKGIEEADIFLFLLSPDSASSNVCKQEIEHAVKNGKRLIPVVVQEISANEAPEELRALNWIFLRQDDDFPTAWGKLIAAIRTDYEWVQKHRRLQVKALEWERTEHENSLLLRGKDLQEAEFQIATNSSKEPHPTDLQREYVLRSRQATDRQRRTITGISILVGAVLAGLAIFGWVQAGRAATNAQTAQAESTRAFHNANTAEAASTLALNNASTAQANAQEAQRQSGIARAGELAAQGLAEDEPIRSLLFSVEAFQRLDSAAQRNSLLTGLQTSPRLNTILHGHGATVWTEAFSPDGKTLAAGAMNGMVTLWSVSDPDNPVQLGVPLDSHSENVWTVDFSPDGNTLAVGTVEHTIVFWDVSNPEAPEQLGESLAGHPEDVRSIVFSPDGRILASGSCGNLNGQECIEGEIILWDISNLQAPKQLGEPLSSHTGDLRSLAFSPDGRTLASASWDTTVILWDISDPRSPTQYGSPLDSHEGPVLSIAFSPDGKTLASGSTDDTIILWDVSNPTEPIQLAPPLKGHRGDVYTVDFSPDNKTLASGSTDHQVILWDVSDSETPTQMEPPLAGHTNNVLSVVFSPDGKTLASGSVDQTVILWTLSNEETPLQLSDVPLSQDLALSLDLSPDGKTLATGKRDASVMLWNVSNPEALEPLGKPLYGHNAPVVSVAISPDGKTLASASCAVMNSEQCTQGEIILWDISNPEAPTPLGQPFVGHEQRIQSLVFIPDGQILASGSWDRTIRLWDISDQSKPVSLGQPLQGYPGSVWSVAISPNGKTLAASGEDLAIMLWDISDPVAPRSLGEMPVRHTSYVWSLAFSPDSKTLASGSWDNSIILWDVSDPTAPFQLVEPLFHRDYVTDVAFSSDGKMLASAACGQRDDNLICTQGDIFLWDTSNPVATLQLGGPLGGHTDDVLAVAFRADSKVLASSGLDGIIRLWDVEPQSWADRACKKAGRNFTSTEWARYFPNEEYHATCSQFPLEP